MKKRREHPLAFGPGYADIKWSDILKPLSRDKKEPYEDDPDYGYKKEDRNAFYFLSLVSILLVTLFLFKDKVVFLIFSVFAA